MTELRTRVLLVEDDDLLRPSLVSLLELSGFDVTGVADGLSFYRALSGGTFDVAVVDLGLPDQSGETLVDYARRNTSLPIVVITARDTLDTRVDCYRTGADLFLAKPVDGRELAAAIASLAARRRSPGPSQTVEEPVWALLASQRTLVGPDGQRMEFTAKEWLFLSLVADRGGECATRESLRLALYGRDDTSADHGLETLVRRTRQKIADALGPGAPGPILTDYGVGYRFGGRTVRRDR